jgi:hypothetical protein
MVGTKMQMRTQGEGDLRAGRVGVVEVSLEEGAEVAWRRGRRRSRVMERVDGEVCAHGAGVSYGKTKGVLVVIESAGAAPFESVRVQVAVNEGEIYSSLLIS